MRMIRTADLRLDGNTQARHMINYPVVGEYAEEIAAGKQLPPPIVFDDGEWLWVADGFHRVQSYLKLGIGQIECDVREGGREQAIWFACGANTAHGLRRTNADKRKAVEMALRLKPSASDREIAAHVGVSVDLVGEMRNTVLSESANSRSRYSKRPEDVAAKRQAVEMALREEPRPKDAEIAERCNCSLSYVMRVRSELGIERLPRVGRPKKDSAPVETAATGGESDAPRAASQTAYQAAFASVRALPVDQQRQLARTVLDILDGRIRE